MNEQLPNNSRNIEVALAINQIKDVGLGYQSDKHSGIANALSALDVAESLQLLQLEIERSSKENNLVVQNSVNRLITSNEHLAKSNSFQAQTTIGLTAALVIVGLLQVLATWCK